MRLAAALMLAAPLVVAGSLAIGRSVWLTFILYHLGICLAAPFLASRRSGAPWRAHAAELGLRRAGLGAGAALGAAAAVMVVVFFTLLEADLLPAARLRATLAAWNVTAASLPALYAFMILGNGAAEELFWRGWLQTRLSARLGAVAAVVIAAACYASYHAFTVAVLIGGAATGALLATGVFAAGCFWGWLRARTGSVWPPLLSHIGATGGYMFVLWRTLRVVAVLIAAAAVGAPALAATPRGRDVRVMSFNIRYGAAEDGANAWPQRRDLLARTVLACEPDVLATQECLADQAAFLREALPGSGFAGAGRDDGALAGEMCALFWNAARWAKLDGGHFWLSETPEAAGSRGWDAALPRIASWVKLRATDDSTLAFCVVNAHFDHVGEVARRESARLLRERSLTIAGSLPLVIAGDFNAPADANADGPYALLTTPAGGAGSGFVDTYRSLSPPGPDEGTYHAFAGTTTGARIDWILVSPDITPVAAAIDRTSRAGRYPSDHFPVTAVVRIGAR